MTLAVIAIMFWFAVIGVFPATINSCVLIEFNAHMFSFLLYVNYTIKIAGLLIILL